MNIKEISKKISNEIFLSNPFRTGVTSPKEYTIKPSGDLSASGKYGEDLKKHEIQDRNNASKDFIVATSLLVTGIPIAQFAGLLFGVRGMLHYVRMVSEMAPRLMDNAQIQPSSRRATK